MKPYNLHQLEENLKKFSPRARDSHDFLCLLYLTVAVKELNDLSGEDNVAYQDHSMLRGVEDIQQRIKDLLDEYKIGNKTPAYMITGERLAILQELASFQMPGANIRNLGGNFDRELFSLRSFRSLQKIREATFNKDINSLPGDNIDNLYDLIDLHTVNFNSKKG